MTTNFSLSQTLASLPKCFLKMPMVPGPQTSCVMRTSTLTQTLSPGATASRPAARARTFSVRVIGGGIGWLRVMRDVCSYSTLRPPPRPSDAAMSRRWFVVLVVVAELLTVAGWLVLSEKWTAFLVGDCPYYAFA